MSESFVHCHAHTSFSMLDGKANVDALVKAVAEQGQPAIAITDHGNMFGAYDLYKTARKYGVKPLIGSEMYAAPGEVSRTFRGKIQWGDGGGDDVSGGGAFTHLTVLAETTEGMHNLFRLSSGAFMDGFYRKPRCDRELLSQYSAGVLGTTGCPSGEVQTRLRLGQSEEALRAAATYRDIFGEGNYYVEIMDHGLDIERRTQEGLLWIAKVLNLPLLATNDLHYVARSDAAAHEHMLCVQSGSKLADPGRFKFDAEEFYLKTASEMRALFPSDVFPGACDNTLLIAERCNVEFDEGADLMPRFPVPEGETIDTWFEKEVAAGMLRRFPSGVPEAKQKLADYEMTVIRNMGFPGYFLVVADYIMWAKKQGIRVGPGRGSAAGSIVAYALGITEIDPVEHKLIFERFLNPERVTMPDIDVDFDDTRRGEVIEYVTEKYGADKVAQIVTFGLVKAKAAVKDAARILGEPFSVGERITKLIPPPIVGKDAPLTAMFTPDHPRYKETADLRHMYDTDAVARQVLDTAVGLEGVTRQWGVHAAGVILSAEKLTDHIPVLRRESDGAIITQFDQKTCETLGLLKMDFLGLRNLTIIDETIKLINTTSGVTIVPESIPYDDPATYELLGRGDTLGVFQLDSGPMRALLRSMRPDTFEDISAVLALYRPGPMAMNSHNEYADRKNGRKPVTPIHPELSGPLDSILEDTYGLCVTGDTLVWDTTRRAVRRIDDIAHDVISGTMSTIAVTSDGVPVSRPVVAWQPTGVKPVLSIAVDSGVTVKVSRDHPMLTQRGWVCAGDLRVGVDKLAQVQSPYDPVSLPSSSSLNIPLPTPPDTSPTVYVSADTVVPVWKLGRTLAGATSHHLNDSTASLAQQCLAELLSHNNRTVLRGLVAFLAHMPRTAFLTPHAESFGGDDLRGAHPDIAHGTPPHARHAPEHHTCGGNSHPHLEPPTDTRTATPHPTPHELSLHFTTTPHLALLWQHLCDRLRIPLTIHHLPPAHPADTSHLCHVTLTDVTYAHLTPTPPTPPTPTHPLVTTPIPTPWDISHFRWNTIAHITPDGEEPMYDITVEDTHTFLANTFIVHNCIYQEQVMAIAQQLAGYSLGHADLLRRAMGKKDKNVLDKEFIPFQEGMLKNGYTQAAITALWDVLVPFADYAFNKAHTVAYGTLSYWTAYFKANHPAEYMSALLTSVTHDKDKTALYMNECRRMGIHILPPDINESGANYTPISATEIRVGLSAIRNVGENVISDIINTRHNQPYTSFNDFLTRVPTPVCNKRVVDSLIKAAAFTTLHPSRAALHTIHSDAIDIHLAAKKKNVAGQFDMFSMFATETGNTHADLVNIPPIPEWDRITRLAHERDMLGQYITDHPLRGYQHSLHPHSDGTIIQLFPPGHTPSRTRVRVAGVITSTTPKKTKKGDTYTTLSLEDTTGAVDILVLPGPYASHEHLLTHDSIITAVVKVDHREDGSYALLGDTFSIITTTPDPEGYTVEEYMNPTLILTLTIPETTLTIPFVTQLKTLFTNNPGTAHIRFRVIHTPTPTNPHPTPTWLTIPHRINPDHVRWALRGLLGDDAITITRASHF